MYLRSVEIITPFFNQIEYQKVLLVRDTLPINDLLQNQTTPRSPNNQRPNPLYRDPRTCARKSRRRPRRHQGPVPVTSPVRPVHRIASHGCIRPINRCKRLGR